MESSPDFTLDCGVSGLRVGPKGIEVDFVSKVYQREELLWEGLMTLLSRSKSTQLRNKTGGLAKKPNDDFAKDIEGESKLV